MKPVVILAFVLCAQSVKLPPNFQKCNRKDPNLNECVLRAAQHGLPQLTKPFRNLNLPSLDPLEISKVHIGAGGGSVSMEQDFYNCSIYGFEKLKYSLYVFDFEAKTLNVKGFYDKILIKCRYQLEGQVLQLPITGSGPAVITLENMDFSHFLNYEEVKKNGKTYIKFVKSLVEIEPKLVTFHFGNLFNGDKVLGDNINAVLNDNWKEVFTDMSKDLNETINQIIMNLLNGFFAKVSIEEAFD